MTSYSVIEIGQISSHYPDQSQLIIIIAIIMLFFPYPTHLDICNVSGLAEGHSWLAGTLVCSHLKTDHRLALFRPFVDLKINRTTISTNSLTSGMCGSNF